MKRSRNTDLAMYCLAAMLLGAAFFLLDDVHGKWAERRARTAVAEQLLQHGSSLGNTVNRTVTLLHGFRSLVEASAERGQLDREFETIAAAVRGQSASVRDVQLIRDGVITRAQRPHQIVATYPHQRPTVSHSVSVPQPAPAGSAPASDGLDGVTIAGPVDGVHPETAIVATIPLRVDIGDIGDTGDIDAADADPGVARDHLAIVLDVPELFTDAAFSTWDPALRFALRDARGKTLFGDANVFAGAPERHRIALLDGYWDLVAVPADGWASHAADQVTGFRIAGLIIAFLLITIFIVAMRSRRLLRHLVERRTNELEALNTELRREIDARRRTETELIAALDKAEHADRLKDSFIATMSHEIRTPLHVILGYVDLLHFSNEQAGEEQAMYRRSMKNAGRRLMRSVEELLHISSLRAGTFTVNPEDFDLVDTAREVVRQFQSDARERGIALRFRSTLRSATVYADRYSLEQSIQNLIDNAIKYTEVGEVEILIRGEGNDCTLAVRDTGIGISDEYLRHIFDVFSQEKTGYSRPYDGLGLGLSLTRQFIELNHGRIEVRSRQGEGTECTIALPTVMPVEHGIAEDVRMDGTPHHSGPSQHGGPSLTLIQHVSQVA